MAGQPPTTPRRGTSVPARRPSRQSTEARRAIGVAIVQDVTARDIETRADCERLVRAFYGRALTDPMIGWIFTDVARARPRGARPGHRVVLGDDPARRASPTAAARSGRTPQLHAKVAAARRPLRALARAVAGDRRRAVRRRARRARQGARACASRGPSTRRLRRAGRAGRRRADGHVARSGTGVGIAAARCASRRSCWRSPSTSTASDTTRLPRP